MFKIVKVTRTPVTGLYQTSGKAINTFIMETIKLPKPTLKQIREQWKLLKQQGHEVVKTDD